MFLGEPSAGEPSALASPVCYATEVDPEHFGEQGPALDRRSDPTSAWNCS
jgi:hypothetical protein